jgi:hypothetical protein
MATVSTSSIANALKETLEEIVTDSTDGVEARAIFTKWLEIKDMEDNYEDDLQAGGPGLASEKTEGAAMAVGTRKEGFLTRYLARTFALKIIVTQEAMEDNKYPKVIDAARQLKRAMWKTADIDATNIAVRGWDTNFVGGDGVPLFSASHTMPLGGSFSNLQGTPMSPSRSAVIQHRTAVGKLPGLDGITEGYELKTVHFPLDQWAVWDGLVLSEKAPEAGQFNEINVVNRLNLKLVPNKYWNNTTTNYMYITDCDYVPNFRWRKRPMSATWADNDPTIMNHSQRARWARGWSDARGAYGVQA